MGHSVVKIWVRSDKLERKYEEGKKHLKNRNSNISLIMENKDMESVMKIKCNLDGHNMFKIAPPECLVSMNNLLNPVNIQESPKKRVGWKKVSRTTLEGHIEESSQIWRIYNTIQRNKWNTVINISPRGLCRAQEGSNDHV